MAASKDPRPCSIADTLALVGEKYSLLVLREVCLGNGRFDQLVRNIGAKVERESTATAGNEAAVDIDAIGSANGQPMKLRGHFEAHGKRFYQVIVMGKASAVSSDNSDQFISSFTLL